MGRGLCFRQVMLVAGSLYGLGATRAGEIDPACLAALRTDGIPAWQAAEQFSNSVVIRCSDQRIEKYFRGGVWHNEVEEWRFCISLSTDKRQRIIECFVPSSAYTRRVVVNPRYRFNVCRTGDPGDSGLKSATQTPKDSGKGVANVWELTRANPGSQDELWSERVPFETEQMWRAEVPYQVLSIPLAEMIGSPDFRLKAAEFQTSPEGGKQAYLEAEYTGPEAGIWRKPGATFWASLNPSPSWLVASGGGRLKSGNSASFIVRYRKLTDGREFPEQLAMDVEYPGNQEKYSMRHETTYELPSSDPIDQAEYSLTYYGIPEEAVADIPERSARPLLGAVLAVVAVALVMLGWFGWRRRS